MTLHPQVATLLERVARSPLPPYYKVPPFVARRIYRDTRGALAPALPPIAESRLLVLDDRMAARLYRPVKDEVLPALVYFHGGGWTIGDLDTHDVCVVISVDYRLAPESPFPAAVDDCLAATRFVFQQSGHLKIDAARIAVGGDSAGGNLAAVVCLHRELPIAFQLLLYPATDQRCEFPSHAKNGAGYLLTRESVEYFRGNYLPRRGDWTDWRASPLLAPSHADLPPAYLITAGFDPLVDEGRAYAAALEKAGVPVEYRNYADMVHGFIVMGGALDTAREAVAECCVRLKAAYERVLA